MNKDSRIYVAGHTGMVGGAICRALKAQGYERIITADRSQVDLCNPMMVEWFFSSYIPEYVFLSAAKVGGIMANSTYPVEFMLDNMRIEMNAIENAKKYGVKKLLFLGSACAYPKLAANPILEEYLLTGALEPSNECYALAKIAGIKLCEAYRKEYGCDFISAMPTNLYGIGDHYSLQDSHVIPGMIRRIHDAKEAGHGEVQLWGSGKPSREFLFSEDLAEACIMLMNYPEYRGLVNIGYGSAIHLNQLASYVAAVVGFPGEIFWDPTKPDGTPERQMDNSKMDSIGFYPRTPLPTGLKAAYQDFLCRKTNQSVP
jgi:GDP-L-fucose synthase